VLSLPGVKVGELRNRAAAAARANVLAFVDADHELGEGWLGAALESIRLPGVGAVGAPYATPTSPSWVQRIYRGFRRHEAGIHDVEWLGAGNMVVRRDLFEAVGGFDVSLEACEDVDLCQRVKRAGFRVLGDSRLLSVHYGDPQTLKSLFLSELWRGRDNVRVTLRGPRTLRNLASAVVPAIELVALALGAVSLLAGLWRAALLSLMIVVGLVVLRTAQIYRRLVDRRNGDAIRAFAVVCAYDLGRALALIARVPHRRARAEDADVPSP
jgi:hypothetical protein